jgi:uncharacterized protein YjiS (DUF1127 family)
LNAKAKVNRRGIMTCRELTTTAMDQATSGYTTRMAATASGLWQAYMRRRTRRATARILRSLDARTLKDIGISPGEIDSVVYGPNGDRRRRY